MTKKLLLLVFCFFILFSCNENNNKAKDALKQENKETSEVATKDNSSSSKKNKKVAIDPIKVYDQKDVTTAAILPFEKEKFPQFIADNLEYDNKNQEELSGNIVADLTIEKNGSVTSVTMIKGMGEDIDRAIANCLKKLPKFTPGKINNQAVRSKLRIEFPLTFKYL